jgi:glycosyltransferase involved in cell wall biosynthesis
MYDLQILLPVHNEAESIADTIREIYAEISPRVAMQFIICEDGSRDNTQDVLKRLSREIPMKLILSRERKGYSRAVTDGMRAMDARYLLCLDSDGQCDPKDFWKFWAARDEASIVLGWRVDRADTLLRRLMSRTFYFVYQALYRTPVHDPSCPFMLARRDVIESLVNQLGAMQQGFWWEFVARSHRLGLKILEKPVHHRLRVAGTTQVYHLRKLPGIGYHHFLALFRIWDETRPHRRETV